MEFIMNYWYVFVGIIAVLIMGGFAIYKFVGLPTKEQLAKITEWLKYAVMLAEKELGGGVGSAKLRFVYDMFIVKFPVTAKLITFDQFSTLVDIALEWLNAQLESNKKIETFVKGEIK